MLIRPEDPSDFDAIDEIVKGAFDGRDEEVRLVRAVRTSEHYVPELTLVAEEGGVVGHIMLSYVHLGEKPVLSLAPLAVRPGHQNKGIGDALSREALRLADAMNEPLVVVLGHPNYYPRFGFEPSRRHGIEPHVVDIPEDVFMVVKLSAYDPELRGRITYPSAFDETS